MEKPIFSDYIELNEDETREFLRKFDREELEYLSFVFYYATSHNRNILEKTIKELESEKDYSNDPEYELDILSKANSLSFKELNYLYNLSLDGYMCTTSVSTLDYTGERIELSNLSDSLYKEIEKRIDSLSGKPKKNIIKL